MFGLIISGRPIVATGEVLSPTQFAFRVPSSPAFSHVGAFLLPGNDLPLDVGATVWIQMPPSADFKLLGALAQTKQSAIFKISNPTKTAAAPADDLMLDETPSAVTDLCGPDIVIGISIEPAAQVEQQLASLKTSTAQPPPAPASPVSTKVLAQRIIGNAFNFLASFGSDTVPLKAFQDWWSKFEKKIELDPAFLEREQG